MPVGLGIFRMPLLVEADPKRVVSPPPLNHRLTPNLAFCTAAQVWLLKMTYTHTHTHAHAFYLLRILLSVELGCVD
jgi:hypothetical protein